jgi:cytoskeletal protein CcmA (bactofilin family)
MKLVKNDSTNSDFGWIGRGIEVTGEIFFAERLQVDGKVKGKLSSESGTLIIGETGHIEAQIDIGTCVIHGAVHGDLRARSRVEIRRTGKVTGDVLTPVLVVEEGAVFNGVIKMGAEAAGRLLEEVPSGGADDEGRRKVKGA